MKNWICKYLLRQTQKSATITRQMEFVAVLVVAFVTFQWICRLRGNLWSVLNITTIADVTTIVANTTNIVWTSLKWFNLQDSHDYTTSLPPRHALPSFSGWDGQTREDFRWLQFNAQNSWTPLTTFWFPFVLFPLLFASSSFSMSIFPGSLVHRPTSQAMLSPIY